MFPNSLKDVLGLMELNETELIQWCIGNGIIKEFNCLLCGKIPLLSHQISHSDSYLWRCPDKVWHNLFRNTSIIDPMLITFFLLVRKFQCEKYI